MKKYLGIIKVERENMSGVNIKFLSKTYDKIETFNKWFELYPGCEHIILPNSKKIDDMFDICRDMTPVTEDEKKDMEQAKILYRKLMKD